MLSGSRVIWGGGGGLDNLMRTVCWMIFKNWCAEKCGGWKEEADFCSSNIKISNFLVRPQNPNAFYLANVCCEFVLYRNKPYGALRRYHNQFPFGNFNKWKTLSYPQGYLCNRFYAKKKPQKTETFCTALDSCSYYIQMKMIGKCCEKRWTPKVGK